MKKQILIVALLLLMAGLSCQTPTQPNPVTIPVTYLIHVRDGNNTDIYQASVSLFRTSPSEFSATSSTDQNGIAKFQSNVPPGDAWYTCSVNATPNYPLVTDTVILGCNDTEIEITLSKSQPAPCVNNTSIQDSGSLRTTCLGKSDSVTSSALNFTCPDSFKVASASFNLIGSNSATAMSLSYRSASNFTSVSNAGGLTGLIVAPNKEFQIKAVYSPKVISASDVGTLTITFKDVSTLTTGGATNPNLNNVVNYTYKASGSSQNCANCNCPDSDFVESLAKPDTVCVFSSDTASFNLSNVINPGDPSTCSWVFTLKSNFVDNSEIEFSPQTTIPPGPLSGGSGLGQLGIIFSPQHAGAYIDSAIFTVSTVQNGVTTTPQCPHELKLHFVGYGSGPTCTVDTDILHQIAVSVGGTNYNFEACAGDSTTKTFEIVNNGACPVQNITISFLNPVDPWEVTPSSILTIPAHDSVQATVTFSPSLTDVFPGGSYCNPPTPSFTNTLIVNGCGNTPYNYVLNGYGEPNCHYYSQVSTPDSACHSQGLEVNGNNTITNDPNAPPWFMYAKNVVAGVVGVGTATLYSGYVPANKSNPTGGFYTSFYRVATGISMPGDICKLGCTEEGMCNLADPTSGPGVYKGTNSINVTAGDVILFNYTTGGQGSSNATSHCGIIYISEMEPDPNQCPQVDMGFCYPIN